MPSGEQRRSRQGQTLSLYMTSSLSHGLVRVLFLHRVPAASLGLSGPVLPLTSSNPSPGGAFIFHWPSMSSTEKESKQVEIQAAVFITFAIATIVMGLRLLSRRLKRIPLSWDDYFAICCYVCLFFFTRSSLTYCRAWQLPGSSSSRTVGSPFHMRGP